MTTLIGLLNKKCIVLAADLSVNGSLRYGKSGNIIKNDTRILRLSDNVERMATCVTTMGNVLFLDHPWETIIGHYRQLSSRTIFKTLEENVDDFFNFLCTNENLWSEDSDQTLIKSTIKDILREISPRISENAQKRDKNGELINREEYEKQLEDSLSIEKDKYSREKIGILFKGFDEREFIRYAEKDYKNVVENQVYTSYNPWNLYYDPSFFKKHKDSFLQLVFYRLVTEKESESTLLVFSGYGEEEKYPSLIEVKVCGGLMHRPVYFRDDRNSVKISETNPAAICKVGSSQVIDSILNGVSDKWLASFISLFPNLNREELPHFGESRFDRWSEMKKIVYELREENYKEWIRELQHLTLYEMAELALNILNMTVFHRDLTLGQQGRGGEIVRAILTKEKGLKLIHGRD